MNRQAAARLDAIEARVDALEASAPAAPVPSDPDTPERPTEANTRAQIDTFAASVGLDTTDAPNKADALDQIAGVLDE